MRGQPQAASARLPAALPRRRWSTWLEQTSEKRRRAREERLETIQRLEAEQRHSRRTGDYAPDLRRLW
ncbi:MAG: hypothetical protein JOZ95_08730 [Solirubrobacterales bacterium]|nr:hypothetical protein [Solirubrobacterales bacterium]